MEPARQGTFDPTFEIRRRVEIARKAVQRWTRRVEGAIAKLADQVEASSKAERIETVARTLLAHMGGLPRGTARVSLPDYSSSDGTGSVEVALDPALGPRENAERMLREARKLRRGAAMIPARKAAMERELEEIAEWERRLGKLAGAHDARLGDPDRPEDLEVSTPLNHRVDQRQLGKMLDELEARLLPRGLWPAPPRKRDAEPERKPVRWTLEGGWILMAGRSGTENDFLTTRIARPDDLWFHVANVPGAHVILRSPDGKPVPPPPQLLEQAASLAAWLSRMRAQERVEVRYTQRRRVRKPRKAPAGTVLMDQSHSILVKPAPPPR